MATVTTSGVDEFSNALARYYEFAGKEQGPLIEDRAGKVRFELYKQFKAISKAPAALRAELAALGYKMKRRIGEDGEPVDADTEIKLRVKSLRFLSVSFLFSSWKKRQGGQHGTFLSQSRAGATIGAANVSTEAGRKDPFVALTSLLEGVVIQNTQRGIADRALIAQAADMETYIARKHEEKMKQLFSKTFEAGLQALA